MVEHSDCISKSDKTVQTERQGQSQGSGGSHWRARATGRSWLRANQEHGGKPIRIFLGKTLIEQLRWNKNTWYMYGERIEDGGRGGEWEWGWEELRVGALWNEGVEKGLTKA